MRKLFAVLLALCLACSMAACAGGNTSSTSSTSTTSESTVAEDSSVAEVRSRSSEKIRRQFPAFVYSLGGAQAHAIPAAAWIRPIFHQSPMHRLPHSLGLGICGGAVV